VFCPVRTETVEWINIEELLNYTPDPVKIVVEKNEVRAELLSLFYFHSVSPELT
jgi:hypothetical protein